MASLIDDFMLPQSGPDQPYAPGDDVITFIKAVEQPVVLEVYRRTTSTYGLRCSAWVAWRDAGNAVRSQSWWQLEPRSVILDSVADAKIQAASLAADHGLQMCSKWRLPAANSSSKRTR